jgi:glycosyltransferase involved in cell wall biosynthesis
MRNGKRVFFNSAWTKRLAEVQIAESIVNAAYFQYPVRFNFVAPLEWPENPIPRLAMVNRLDSHQKGIDVALEAVSRLKAAGTLVQLSIVGSGPEREYLGDLARFLGVSEIVTFVGYSDDLKALWERHELLVLPSRYEGLGVVMIEAMGFGRPVLRTPHGGAEEWIVDGETGFLCPGAEVDLVVATLERALAARHQWRSMGVRAHERVSNGLDRKPARTFLLALNPETRVDDRPAQGGPR